MLVNFWERQQYPPKVILLNEAVIALLSEGRDINSLRVSEITQKAGIGKGTAYEYFSNKEEMIVTALEYDLARQIENLVEREKDAAGFRDMLERMVDWMTENFKNNAGFMLLFQMANVFSEMPHGVAVKIQSRCSGKKEAVSRMIQQVLKVGEAEGTIQKRHPYYGTVAVISQVMAYSMYLSDGELPVQIPEKDAKDFVVESIIKMLA